MESASVRKLFSHLFRLYSPTSYTERRMARAFNLKKILAPVSDIVRRLNERRRDLMDEVQLIEGELKRFGGNGRRSPAVEVVAICLRSRPIRQIVLAKDVHIR